MTARPLKILLTAHQFFPRSYHGTERYALELAKSLQTFGHKVVVLTASSAPDDIQDEDWQEYAFEGIRVLAVDLAGLADNSFAASFQRRDLDGLYGEILTREQPDIIHCCHLLHLGTNFATVASLARVPVLMTWTDFFGICWTNRLQTCTHQTCLGPDAEDLNCRQDALQTLVPHLPKPVDSFVLRHAIRSRLGTRLAGLLIRRGWIGSPTVQSVYDGMVARRPCITRDYATMTRYVAPTLHLRDAYVRAGYPPDKIVHAPYGIAQPDTLEKERLRQRYASLQTGDRPLVFGFIGQMARHKGILDLLDAFAQAVLPPAVLLLYGNVGQDAPTRTMIKAHARKDPRILLQGVYPGHEVYARLAGIDVLVVPSTWAENSPLVLLNALASKTMVIVSAVEGITELVQDGGNGRCVPPGDPAALARMMATVAAERTHLLAWHDRTEGYRTTPSDNARTVEELYHSARAGLSQSADWRRENFPAWRPSASDLRLRRLDAPPAGLGPVEFGDGPHEAIGLSAADGQTTMTLLRPKSFVLISGHPAFSTCGEIRLEVCWSAEGYSQFSYGTASHPKLVETQKLLKHVPAGVWFSLRLRLDTPVGRMTRLRWYPLLDTANVTILVRNLRFVPDGNPAH